MSTPFKETTYQELRDMVVGSNTVCSHSLDRHLRQIHKASLKEMLHWSLCWLSYVEYQEYLELNKEAICEWELKK